MTKLESTIEQLAQALKDLPEVKAFFALREQILHDPFLQATQARMKHHQKLMMKHLHEAPIYQEHKQAYTQEEQAFSTHPLVVNYQHLKDQLAPLLSELQAIIE